MSPVELSNALAAVVADVAPSVLRVEGRRRLPASGVAWSADGLVVTASHVVRRDADLAVGLEGGDRAPAALVGHDPSTDLAVLRVAGLELAPAQWAEPETSGVGQLVLALARPGHTVQATHGIVSALGGAWHTAAGGEIDRYLQTDVLMYPGFSGGPLVDAAGRVAGLNTSALVRGISVAVPTATVRRVVEALVTHGRIRRGYLGVTVQPVKLPGGFDERLDQASGLLLTAVEDDGPADRSGLRVGDIVLSLGDAPLLQPDDLVAALGAGTVGQTVPARVLRGAGVHDLDVVVGERS